MKKVRNLSIAALSALAVSTAPLNFQSIAFGSLEPSSAFAKGGNGHGGGNGNGGGNGHGGGNAGERGNSGKAHGGSDGIRGGPRSPGKMLKSIFGEATHGAKKKGPSASKVARSRKSPRAVEVAAVPDVAPVPTAKPDQGALHARLAGLNSLQRNYHAYVNSQSPRFASIFAFVRDSAEGVLGLDEDDLKQALLDSANRNRVAQYGDDYLNDDVMDWSENVLGLGDAGGKIDEVQDSMEVDGQ